MWLGNSRGSDHGLRHKTFALDSREFWTFSWHEIGFYDLPAMIDYMLAATKSPKTYYVGHSQGCTSFAVLMSTRPEYNQKIIQAHLMAPAVFMSNLPMALMRVFAPAVRVRFVTNAKKICAYLDSNFLRLSSRTRNFMHFSSELKF